MTGAPPWHPAFVHFPLACWVLATLFDVAALAGLSLPSEWGLPDPGAVSVLLLWLGLATSLPAVGFGLVDFAKLPAAARDSAEMLRHVAWMAAALTLFLVSALLRVADAIPAPYFTAIEVLGTVCLVAGGHFAAVVVFERLPEAAADARSPDRDLST